MRSHRRDPKSATTRSPLATFKGQSQVLLSLCGPLFTNQQHQLKNQASKYRDLDPIDIVTHHAWVLADPNRPNTDVLFTTGTEQIDLRGRYRIHPQYFVAILRGKDDGEKLRFPTPVTMEKLTTQIDTTPMRQQELRQRTLKST